MSERTQRKETQLAEKASEDGFWQSRHLDHRLLIYGIFDASPNKTEF